VEAAIAAGENRQRIKYSYEWNDRLAEIETRASIPQEGDYARQIANQVDAINEEYRLATGSSSGLIPPSQRAALVSQNAKAIVHEQQRQVAELQRRQERLQDRAERDARDKTARQEALAAKAQLKDLYKLSIANGSFGVVMHAPGANAREMNDTFWEGWVGAGDKSGFLTPGQVTMMASVIKTNAVIPQVQDFLTGQIKDQMTSGEVTQKLRGAEANYRRLRDVNPELAHKYYGDMAPRMEAYTAAIDANVPEAVAFKNHFMTSRGLPRVDEKDRVAAARSAGDTDFLTRIGSWVGETVRMAPGQDAKLAAHLKPAADLWMKESSIDINEAYKKAWGANKDATVELIGGYVVPKGAHDTPLAMKLVNMELPGTGRPVGTDSVHHLVRDAINGVVFGDSKGAYVAKDMDEIQVIRQDVGPTSPPLLQVTGWKDGKTFNHIITHQNMADLVRKGYAATHKDDYRANPDIVDLTNK
jgi:hypothetical protein